MVFLKPATMLVAKIITTMLKAIATTANRRIALEKDFWVAVPTLRAMRNSRFTSSIGQYWMRTIVVFGGLKVGFFLRSWGYKLALHQSAMTFNRIDKIRL